MKNWYKKNEEKIKAEARKAGLYFGGILVGVGGSLIADRVVQGRAIDAFTNDLDAGEGRFVGRVGDRAIQFKDVTEEAMEAALEAGMAVD